MTPDLLAFFLNAVVGCGCGAAAGWHYDHGRYSWAGVMQTLMLLNIGLAVVQ